MRLRNLTPHPITLILDNGRTIVLPSEGVARARQTTTVVGSLILDDGTTIPVVQTTYHEPENLPPPEKGVALIVSALTAAAVKAYAPHRSDVFIVAETVRDENGNVIGAKALAQLS